VWVVCAVLIGACAAARYPPPAPARHTKTALTISGFTLTNGLRVVLVRDVQAAEIQITMRYQVGAVDDPREHPGMAHLVEHLMFQQVLGSETLFAHLQNKATYFNAATSFDATTYVARGDAARLDELLSIEAIRVGFRCTGITDSTFVREREVVANEVRERDDATEMRAAIHDALYPVGHPYRRSIGGTVESVGAITREQACAFADAHYAPGNAVLVISGDVTAPRVEAALGKFLARIAGRSVVLPSQVPQVAAGPRRVTASAPLDDDALLLAWPIPVDPQPRARFRAIAAVAASLIDAQIRGTATPFELGDGRAPIFGIIVIPAAGESLEEVVKGAKLGVEGLPGAFHKTAIAALGDIAFDGIHQRAIHALFTSLEDGGDRDTRLAAHVLAGREPNMALAAEFQGIRDMNREDAASIASEHLSFNRATVVTLKATAGKKRGREATLAAAIHDPGLRRDPPDPAEARRPVDRVPRGLLGVKTRVLPNGLNVVLLPLTSVPTVDIRLVFRSGTADEPTDKRGAALVAAHALTWDFRYVNDLLLFAAVGGTNLVEVETDHTTLTARGVDMHLDVLLAGLRRWVREGTYDGGADSVVDAMRRETKKLDDELALTDAWRTARFGAGHPYVAAGIVRHASPTLTVDDAERFRATHYTPDNATLVIAGRFDAALADRWIDYLFADWTGHVVARGSRRAATQPASIAKIDDITQVHLRIAFPANAGSRAQQLVAAEMLADIASDVRHQLGASYGVQAHLGESRLATNYSISGSIDAPRAAAAVQLLRERIEMLHTEADTAARAFVSARRRVLTNLVSVTGSAEMLATRVARDIEMQRPPMSDLQTADVVGALTIDGMTATLADLDLSRAAVLMRGPIAEMQSAFGVLGRTPTQVRFDQVEQDAREAPLPGATTTTTATSRKSSPVVMMSDIVEPLTKQGPAQLLTLTLAAGYSKARLIGSDMTGFAVAAEIGFRSSVQNAVGLHLAIGSLNGSFTNELSSAPRPLELIPIDLALFLQTAAYDRLWGAAILGLHVDRVTKEESEWHKGIGLGLHGGVDILKLGNHRVGVSGSLKGSLASETGFGGFVIGLAYRQ